MLSGIVTDVIPEQPKKADSPMPVTPFGIVIGFRLEFMLKAFSPIPATDFPPMIAGITTSPPVPLYPVITTPPPSDPVLLKSPHFHFFAFFPLFSTKLKQNGKLAPYIGYQNIMEDNCYATKT
jgi:hypothetical protein